MKKVVFPIPVAIEAVLGEDCDGMELCETFEGNRTEIRVSWQLKLVVGRCKLVNAVQIDLEL